MDELLEQFLVEGRDLVEQASEDLLALERVPGDAARIDSAFRAVHTLKGSVGLFDFAPMAATLHAAEDVMGALRDGRLHADRDLVGAMMQCISTVDGWLEGIARSGGLPPGADDEARRLRGAMHAFAGAPEEKSPARGVEAEWLPALLATDRQAFAAAAATGRALIAVRYTPDPACFFRGDDPLALLRAVPDLVIVHIAPRDPWPASGLDPFACNLVIGFVSFAARDDLRRIFQLVVDQVAMAEIGVSREVVPREVVPREGVSREGVSPGAASGGPPAEPEHGALTHTLRIDASRIDALADLVGELIVAKNRLAHLVGQTMHAAPALGRALDANQVEIERLVADLHRGVMAARMVTLTQMFGRLNRLVRDTAGRLGKDVHFETSGAATEADKSVVDGLYEPLLHVLRNAMDHGVEQAAARAASGKARAGRITLDAARARDRIVITVTDDGAGMDPARLRETARRRGLMADARLDALDDAALLDLVFTPGFSTASAVTEVSGRGVGLDAVRRSIEAMGGRVTIASTPGAGTTVRLAVPQAVTVTTVIMVRIGDERFGVPLEIVAETVRIARDQIRAVGDGVAFVLRDRTIPLVRLADLLDSPASARDVRRDAPDLHALGRDAPRPDAKVLVIEAGEQRTGIEVDGLAERIDVVIRPLEGLLAGARGLVGTALLGDGSVLMVVNLPELIAWMPHCNIGA